MERDSTLDTRFHRGRGLGSRITRLLAAAALWAAVPNVGQAQNGDSSGVRLFEAGKFKEA